VSGQSFISLTDFGTIRARAGWAVGGFLPYLTGGVALGRASYGTTATLYQNTAICVVADCTGVPNPWASDSVRTASSNKGNALIYGFSAGLGMDWALTQNIFVRAEYEYIQFSQMRLNLNNARVGAGVKF
jgi:outer membrane immunogenic protein